MIKKKYIVPNAITAGNMCLGYISIIESIKGEYIAAIFFIIMAMICDGLDGKTARKLNAFSEFGKEFDSFSDAISFGLAPAILAFCLLSKNPATNPLAISVSLLYALCGVMRLVKFNVITVASDTKDDFSGMPIPNAAGMVISYFLSTYYLNKYTGVNLFDFYFFIGVTVISALLMVSTIPFKTPDKTFKFIPKKLVIPFVIVSLLGLIFSIFIITYTYAFINVLKHVKRKLTGSSCDSREIVYDEMEEGLFIEEDSNNEKIEENKEEK